MQNYHISELQFKTLQYPFRNIVNLENALSPKLNSYLSKIGFRFCQCVLMQVAFDVEIELKNVSVEKYVDEFFTQIASDMNLQRFISKEELMNDYKVQTSVFYAIIGAILIDSNGDYFAARHSILKVSNFEERVKKQKQVSVEVQANLGQDSVIHIATLAKKATNKRTFDHTREKGKTIKATGKGTIPDPRAKPVRRLFAVLPLKTEFKPNKPFEYYLKEALNNGFDINEPNQGEKQNTLLLTLLLSNHLTLAEKIERAKLLVRYGAKWDAPNKRGLLPEDVCIEQGFSQEEIAQIKRERKR